MENKIVAKFDVTLTIIVEVGWFVVHNFEFL